MAIGKENLPETEGDDEILKPCTHKKEYRRIVLKNSLVVLLISDPETDKCAASMNVSVGSFSDPEGLEGLAHFLEHMLFYASEKYPEEDSYSQYIVEHGGSTNAYMASQDTNYHFDIKADCFDEGLDRFSQFFIKPLMSADATMRDIKAVDSGSLLLSGCFVVALCRLTNPYEFSFIQRIRQTCCLIIGVWASNVTALIGMKLEKHKNLTEESSFFWQEIQNGTLKFNRKEAEVAALKQLKKEELIDFFNEYIKV